MILYLSLLDNPNDHSKFTQLYNAYRYTMMYTADNILNDHQLAEDAVHDAFIRIAKNFHKVGPIENPRTKAFVVIITRNVALSMAKRMGRMIIRGDENILSYIADKTTDRDFDKLDYESIVKAIKELPLTYRDTLYLYTVEEYSIKEISEILQIGNEAVKKRLQRGRKILIDKITAEGFIDV